MSSLLPSSDPGFEYFRIGSDDENGSLPDGRRTSEKSVRKICQTNMDSVSSVQIMADVSAESEYDKHWKLELSEFPFLEHITRFQSILQTWNTLFEQKRYTFPNPESFLTVVVMGEPRCGKTSMIELLSGIRLNCGDEMCGDSLKVSTPEKTKKIEKRNKREETEKEISLETLSPMDTKPDENRSKLDGEASNKSTASNIERPDQLRSPFLNCCPHLLSSSFTTSIESFLVGRKTSRDELLKSYSIQDEHYIPPPYVDYDFIHSSRMIHTSNQSNSPIDHTSDSNPDLPPLKKTSYEYLDRDVPSCECPIRLNLNSHQSQLPQIKILIPCTNESNRIIKLSTGQSPDRSLGQFTSNQYSKKNPKTSISSFDQTFPPLSLSYTLSDLSHIPSTYQHNIPDVGPVVPSLVNFPDLVKSLKTKVPIPYSLLASIDSSEWTCHLNPYTKDVKNSSRSTAVTLSSSTPSLLNSTQQRAVQEVLPSTSQEFHPQECSSRDDILFRLVIDTPSLDLIPAVILWARRFLYWQKQQTLRRTSDTSHLTWDSTGSDKIIVVEDEIEINVQHSSIPNISFIEIPSVHQRETHPENTQTPFHSSTPNSSDLYQKSNSHKDLSPTHRIVSHFDAHPMTPFPFDWNRSKQSSLETRSQSRNHLVPNFISQTSSRAMSDCGLSTKSHSSFTSNLDSRLIIKRMTRRYIMDSRSLIINLIEAPHAIDVLIKNEGDGVVIPVRGILID